MFARFLLVTLVSLIGISNSLLVYANITIERHAAVSTKIPIMVVVIQPKTGVQQFDAIDYLVKDLELSGQCAVHSCIVESVPKNSDIKEFFNKGYPLALFLTIPSYHFIEYRLYETATASMMSGKRLNSVGTSSVRSMHRLANLIWPLLTGETGCFGSKIAYCQDHYLSNGRTVQHIMLADFDGEHMRPLVTVPTVHGGLRWNNDTENPLLFFYEHTRSNIRLRALDRFKRTQTVSDFDGLNMLPSFSPDGQKVVYCASKGRGVSQLYSGTPDGVKQLCTLSGQVISPSFSSDGKTVYFCSDYIKNTPHIYGFVLETGAVFPVTNGSGYAVSPACHPHQEKVAYSRKTDGVLQVFVWDRARNAHDQITKDSGHKDNCTWSPCGNYLAYSVDHDTTASIVIIHLGSRVTRTLTPSNQRCTWPAWSPFSAQG